MPSLSSPFSRADDPSVAFPSPLGSKASLEAPDAAPGSRLRRRRRPPRRPRRERRGSPLGALTPAVASEAESKVGCSGRAPPSIWGAWEDGNSRSESRSLMETPSWEVPAGGAQQPRLGGRRQSGGSAVAAPRTRVRGRAGDGVRRVQAHPRAGGETFSPAMLPRPKPWGWKGKVHMLAKCTAQVERYRRKRAGNREGGQGSTTADRSAACPSRRLDYLGP